MQVETVPALAALTAAGISEATRDTLATRAISHLGENLDELIASSESLAGTPALAHDTIAYYQSAADATVAEAVGAENVQAFYDFARLPENAAELKRSLVQHFYTHRTDAYGPLLERFLRLNEPTAAATRAAGIKTFGRNDEMIVIGGISMTRKVAARAGLI